PALASGASAIRAAITATNPQCDLMRSVLGPAPRSAGPPVPQHEETLRVACLAMRHEPPFRCPCRLRRAWSRFPQRLVKEFSHPVRGVGRAPRGLDSPSRFPRRGGSERIHEARDVSPYSVLN